MKFSNLIKTSQQIERMRTACGISGQLHLQAMQSACVGITERELAKRIKGSFECSQAESWAYPLILGSGDRARILHAKPTSRILGDGELLLMDCGVRYQGICSDITRTWPIGKKFTKGQAKVYDIVLKTQKEVIKAVRPGQTLFALHQLCNELLLEGCLSAGLIKGKKINKLFPHRTSHWIGEKVHDQCPYLYEDQSPVLLAPGMCFTVEPGLYLKKIAGDGNGVGIRIEDVVLVTERGHEVLSHVPKERAAIEELRSWSP